MNPFFLQFLTAIAALLIAAILGWLYARLLKGSTHVQARTAIITGIAGMLVVVGIYLLSSRYLSSGFSLVEDIAPQLDSSDVQIRSFTAWPSEAFAVEYCGCGTGDVYAGNYAVRIDFDADKATSPAFWGVWGIDGLSSSNASRFDQLSFWVKGKNGGERFEIKLQYKSDAEKVEIPVVSSDYITTTTNWERVSIPLADFEQVAVRRTELNGLFFGFNQKTGSATVFIDNIGFEGVR